MASPNQLKQLGYRFVFNPEEGAVFVFRDNTSNAAGFERLRGETKTSLENAGLSVETVNEEEFKGLTQNGGLKGFGYAKGDVTNVSNLNEITDKFIDQLRLATSRTTEGDTKVGIGNVNFSREQAEAIVGDTPFSEAALAQQYAQGEEAAKVKDAQIAAQRGLEPLVATKKKSPEQQKILDELAAKGELTGVERQREIESQAGVKPIAAPDQVEPKDDLSARVASADPSLIANKEYVNAVFKALHGRDANQTELDRFVGQTVGSVREVIQAGAKTAFGGEARAFPSPSGVGADQIQAGTGGIMGGTLDVAGTTEAQAQQAGAFSTDRGQILRDVFKQMGLGTTEEISGLTGAIGEGIVSQEQALRALPSTIKERTQNVGVTQGQLNRLIATEREPVAQALKDLLTSRSLLQEQVAFGFEQAEFLAEGQEKKMDRYAGMLSDIGLALDPRTGEIVESFEAGEAHKDRIFEDAKLLDVDVSGLTKDQFDRLNTLRDDFRAEATVESFEVIKNQFKRLQSSAQAVLKNDSAAGSLGVIFSYMKILDPTSVVREGEQASAANATGVPDRIKNLYNKVLTGERLSPAQTRDFLQRATDFYSENLSQYNATLSQYKSLAERSGVDSSLLVSAQDSSLGSVMKPLKQNYASLDSLIKNRPDYLNVIEDLELKYPDITDAEIMRLLQKSSTTSEPFSQDLSMSKKGSSSGLLGLGAVTGYGSPYWKHGLDIDLKIGDSVPAPSAGKVIAAGYNGGFGNQVKIETSQGNIVWLSHLDSIDVDVGDSIRQGQPVGKGGNTGNVIPMGGGDGSHLDLTVQKPNGSYFSPKEIEEQVKKFYV